MDREKIPVETQIEFIKHIKADPLPQGKYDMYVILQYEGQEEPAQSHDYFEVKNIGPLFSPNVNSFLGSLGIVVLAGGILTFLIFMKHFTGYSLMKRMEIIKESLFGGSWEE